MTSKVSILLRDEQQGHAALLAIWKTAKQALRDGRRMLLTLAPETRTVAQNRRYWGKGVLAQVAEKAMVGNRRFSAEAWHEQFKRQFIGVIETPDGRVMGSSSKKLSVKEFAEFSERVEAYAASELGVEFENLESKNG